MADGDPRPRHDGASTRRRLTGRTLRAVYHLGWPGVLLVIEALMCLGLARLLLLTIPFKRIAPHLGRQMAETDQEIDMPSARTAQRVGWVVRRLSKYTPWDSKCLAQAIAAKRMLQRRGIPTTLYLGVAKDDHCALIAHAWLRCGSHFETGGAGHEHYTIVCTFGAQD